MLASFLARRVFFGGAPGMERLSRPGAAYPEALA